MYIRLATDSILQLQSDLVEIKHLFEAQQNKETHNIKIQHQNMFIADCMRRVRNCSSAMLEQGGLPEAEKEK